MGKETRGGNRHDGAGMEHCIDPHIPSKVYGNGSFGARAELELRRMWCSLLFADTTTDEGRLGL